jgi:hypothetical protein
MMVMPHPTLLVLDLNGLFIERKHVSKVEHHRDTYKCNFKTPNGYYVFVRPYTKDFLRYVFDHFHVGVWSCMNDRNTNLIVNKLFTREQQNALEFVMTQEDCYQTGEFKKDGSPIFYKNLTKIWKIPRFHKFYNHTLLIDDSENKTKYNPEFTSVHPTPFNHNYKNDKELKKLHKYLLNVGAYETVPLYVNIQPYNNETKVKKVRFSEIYDDDDDYNSSSNSQKKLKLSDEQNEKPFFTFKQIGHKKSASMEEQHQHDNQYQQNTDESAFKSTCRVLMKTIVFIGGVKLLANIYSKLMVSMNQYI